MRLVSPILVLLVLLAAASAAASARTPARRAELRVREVLVPGSPIPTEGEISYVRVTTRTGATVRQAKLPFGGASVRILVGRGSYTVAVWHRTCDANCNYLDPPTDRCRAVVTVRPEAIVQLTVRNRPGSPCRIVRTA